MGLPESEEVVAVEAQALGGDAPARGGMVASVLWLAGVQAANYALPLVTIPYLTRVLGAGEWGLVAQGQAMALYLVILVEYGFVFSGTRQAALCRERRGELGELMAGVTGAKLLLVAPACVLAVGAWWWVPAFEGQGLLVGMAAMSGVLQGLHPLWFFQGIERVKLIAGVDIAAKALTAVGIILLVRGGGEGWRVLGLQGLGAGISTVVGMGLARRWSPWVWPTPGRAWGALRMGASMAVFRGASSLYVISNAMILGLFQPSSVVAYYAGPEKLTKAVSGLFAPVSQVVYPRLAYLLGRSRREAGKLACRGLAAYAGIGVVAALGMMLTAGWVAPGVLGEEFGPAVGVMRVMALTVPLIAMSNVLGILWMLPLRMDRRFNAVVMGAGVLNVLLGVLVAPRWGAVGMAWVIVLVEGVVTLAVYGMLRRARMEPWRVGDVSEAGGEARG
ncbi:MAG: oligosaccharide flippase family protein [Phycisphaeraceae bacterium]|nr:oligosaccharide flippase family protein [Phycisphaeraceae bacterium]